MDSNDYRINGHPPEGNLPSNVPEEDHLSRLKKDCLVFTDKGNMNEDEGTATMSSTQRERPLRHIDDAGNEYFYSSKPMQYSVFFILFVELFERFAFYGIYYTQTLYLTGAYNKDWNAGFDSIEASSFVSTSTMVAYTTPFIGAYVSDSLFGDYHSLLIGLLIFYIPGVALVVLTTIPNLLGDEFNHTILAVGFLFLWPLGTGMIKSIVNVFGAKQFHPVLHSSLIESYYVSFYTVINVGALIGICMIPIIAQKSVIVAYTIPLVLLNVAVICLLLGTSRYIVTKPSSSGDRVKKKHLFPCFSDKPDTKNHIAKPTTLFDIFLISMLVVPFNIGYNQMPTTFIVQGSVMSKAFGVVDVASMNSLDTISVLIFGYLTTNCIYPFLAKRGIRVPTTYKFAIGSLLGGCAVVWAIIVERKIHSTFERTGEQISVIWQAPSYILIGFGEIFAVCSAYEVAFTASPPDKKAFASAINIFCIGGLPSLICIALFHSCRKWFTNSRGDQNIANIEDYSTAHVGFYFAVLLGIMVFGAIINVMPFIREYVESVEERSLNFIKLPQISSVAPRQEPKKQNEEFFTEKLPLLAVKPTTKTCLHNTEYGSGLDIPGKR